MRTSLIVRVAGLVIVALAVGLALVPFDHDVPIRGRAGSLSLWSSCGAPVREVLRNQSANGSFFGYVPLSSHQRLPGHVGCAGAARTPLGISVAGILVAVVLGAVALFMDRDNRRRRRSLQLGL